ncbi:MAG TPA: type II secretion system F family protein [Actinocrinis sp.]|nr:type II secretion system F family protein [Actinocrinis sp.]
MNPSELFDLGTLEAVLTGLAVGGGLALFVAALVGFRKREPDPDSLTAAIEKFVQESPQRLIVALVLGILVALLTGWPVAGIATTLLIVLWNKLFGGLAGERLAAQRIEALAMWTESLRDTIAGAVGLEQAIPASARAAAPALRPHLNTLLDRLRARMPLPDALQFLADDIDDASADLVISALMLNAKLRGPGLREVLGALARSAREEVDMRQRVMAQRAGTRRSVQIIVVVVAVVVLGVALLAHNFVKPYDSAVGQIVLCAVIGLFGAGFYWMRRLADVPAPSRLLVRRSPGERRAAEGMTPGPQPLSRPAMGGRR